MPLLGKFITKIMNYGNFGGCKPPFLKQNSEGVDLVIHPPHLIFLKIIQGGSSGQIVTKKNEFFDLLLSFKPTFL